jgi:DNA-binding MarR family transcriptional regulator
LYTNDRGELPVALKDLSREVRTDPPIYALDEQVGHLLRRAHQRHAVIFQEGIGPAALTPMQWAALVTLVRQGRASQNRLGRLTAMDPATIQGVVRRLRLRGLIARSADPADRRASVLAPTVAGIALVEATLPAALAISEATLAPLDAAERRVFLDLLQRMAFA